MMQLDEMRTFVGKKVRITFNYEDPTGQDVGVLLGIGNEGEVNYLRDGVNWSGWPCLAVELFDENSELTLSDFIVQENLDLSPAEFSKLKRAFINWLESYVPYGVDPTELIAELEDK